MLVQCVRLKDVKIWRCHRVVLMHTTILLVKGQHPLRVEMFARHSCIQTANVQICPVYDATKELSYLDQTLWSILASSNYWHPAWTIPTLLEEVYSLVHSSMRGIWYGSDIVIEFFLQQSAQKRKWTSFFGASAMGTAHSAYEGTFTSCESFVFYFLMVQILIHWARRIGRTVHWFGVFGSQLDPMSGDGGGAPLSILHSLELGEHCR